ncbi:hypothetical protein QJS04_geneDACA000379 [Acorus gramineus]|uniref:C2 domain-containing protein n=1 Tax=Acorus gramineus TaxID=55184 RepID=A0AAV9APR6_ACOGR|nr:hypothetical protein QJS04_geneDACA000379 [Acorus gramineus]
MGSRYEVEVTIVSAKDLKNVNWRHGDLKPYAVVWVDPASKCSTKAAVDGDANPVWDEKLVLPLPPDRRIDDSVLSIDVVHAMAAEDVKPLIGSARIPLKEVLDEVGIGGKAVRSLKLKRPSGRPHGRLEAKISVREPSRYAPPPPDPYAAPVSTRDPYASGGSYGGPASRDPYASGGSYGGGPYGYAPPPPYGQPPVGYPYNPPPPPIYGQPPPPVYGQPPPPMYGQAPAYGASAPPAQGKSKFGMGTGLAVGAAAGVLGGLALAEGVDYVEDKIADDVADRVEDDYGDGGFGDDDF